MSMTREQMVGYLENPALLNEKTLGELKEILEEFPYFQTAHLLYTRNLLNENNFRFANQLKVSAIHATDRTVLYHLLNPVRQLQKDSESLEIDIPAGHKEKETEEHPIIEAKTIRPVETSQDVLNFEAGESAYRLEGVDAEPGKTLSQLVKEINEGAEKANSTVRMEQNVHLIDRFLKENPSLSNRGIGVPENRYNIADHDDTANENDEFITETLARIYIKQGLYQKAIDAFQRLTLKYPEKSVYFARQIEEVTNLLNK
jgi:tetratricopeptide (TPR) repeat protein